MLRGDDNIYRYTVLGSLLFPYLISLVELHVQIVIFSEIVKSFYECCDKNVLRSDDRHTQRY